MVVSNEQTNVSSEVLQRLIFSGISFDHDHQYRVSRIIFHACIMYSYKCWLYIFLVYKNFSGFIKNKRIKKVAK